LSKQRKLPTRGGTKKGVGGGPKVIVDNSERGEDTIMSHRRPISKKRRAFYFVRAEKMDRTESERVYGSRAAALRYYLGKRRRTLIARIPGT